MILKQSLKLETLGFSQTHRSKYKGECDQVSSNERLNKDIQLFSEHVMVSAPETEEHVTDI